LKLKESSKIELKKSTAELKHSLESICAFANGGEGIVYFGVDDKGKVVGQEISDATIKRVSTTILSSIEPTVFPNVFEDEINGKKVLVIEIKNATHIPYYLKGKVYKRVGTSNVVLSNREIRKMVAKHVRDRNPYETLPIVDYKNTLRGQLFHFL
jgi:ATP-dependent DNA helicase RecG